MMKRIPFTILLLMAVVTCTQTEQELPRRPVSLRPDISVEHFLKVGPGCLRILQDPITKDLFYTTFTGDVFRVIKNRWGRPESERVYSAADHGITRLQGAAFSDSTLFLIGNFKVNNGKGTKGIGMRSTLTPGGVRALSLLFITEEIGGTKTIFDHGFNGIAVDPEKKFLYINSGARTDHGEIQDNDGNYPGSRDEPLTACVMRIPINARGLYLPNDLQFLKDQGYLFADGIRNAYDLEFSPDGKLFAVVNSGDYDHPEDMFWLRQGRHYGFPWVMGQLDNPQQDSSWMPDPATDPFIPPTCHAWLQKYFRNDPTFPPRPDSIAFTEPVLNLGPDANIYRDQTSGKIVDADTTGILLGTFTPHRSPLGLFFDQDSILAGDLKGGGFVLSWTDGESFPLMKPVSPYGEDLMHLDLSYDAARDNYQVRTTRIVDNFLGPTDAVMIHNEVFVIEYNASRANIWKVTLPAD